MRRARVSAFSESLCHEVTKNHERVLLVEPGADTELAGHNRPEVLETIKQRFAARATGAATTCANDRRSRAR